MAVPSALINSFDAPFGWMWDNPNELKCSWRASSMLDRIVTYVHRHGLLLVGQLRLDSVWQLHENPGEMMQVRPVFPDSMGYDRTFPDILGGSSTLSWTRSSGWHGDPGTRPLVESRLTKIFDELTQETRRSPKSRMVRSKKPTRADMLYEQEMRGNEGNALSADAQA